MNFVAVAIVSAIVLGHRIFLIAGISAGFPYISDAVFSFLLKCEKHFHFSYTKVVLTIQGN